MENEQILHLEQAGQPGRDLQPEQPEQLPVKTKAPLGEAVFAWSCYALAFVFTHFCTRWFGGVWGGIFWSVFGILGAVYARFKAIKFTVSQTVIFVIAEGFCLTPLFCTNEFICFLAAVFSFALLFYLMLVITGAEPFGKHFALDMALSVLVRPFESFVKQPVFAFSIFNGRSRMKNMLYALIGLLLAVPLTIVVVVLLISSDAAFEETVGELLKHLPKMSFAYFWELLFAVPIAMYLFGAVFGMCKDAPNHFEGVPQYRFIPGLVSYFAVTPICVFYLVYVITQIRNISRFNQGTLNYAEFARNGFFELCAIAVIDMFVIVIMQVFSKRREDDARPPALRVYTVMLSLFTLAIIATALTKMMMYVGRYGMTLLRVYTSWFMILLGLIFITAIILQICEIPLWRVVFAEFTLMFGLLCFGDFEGQIARYNIRAYQSGAIAELDVDEFEELGFSAVKPAAELLEECHDSALIRELRDFLFQQGTRDGERNKFAYFSIPRAQAQKVLKDMGMSAADNSISIIVKILGDGVYGLSAQYGIDRTAIGSEEAYTANYSTFKNGDIVSFTVSKKDLDDPELLEEGRFGMSFKILSKYNSVPIGGVYEWDAEWGETYWLFLYYDLKRPYGYYFTFDDEQRGADFEFVDEAEMV